MTCKHCESGEKPDWDGNHRQTGTKGRCCPCTNPPPRPDLEQYKDACLEFGSGSHVGWASKLVLPIINYALSLEAASMSRPTGDKP